MAASAERGFVESGGEELGAGGRRCGRGRSWRQQAAALEFRAAQGRRGREQRIVAGEGCCGGRGIGEQAGLQQGGEGGVLVERRTAGDGEVGCPQHGAVEDPLAVLLEGVDQRRRPVRDPEAEDAGVLRREGGELGEGKRERVQAEGGGLQRMPAPVGFGMVAGVRVLEGEQRLPAGPGRRLEGERRLAPPRAGAVEGRALVGGEVEDVASRTLVGGRDRAAARERDRGQRLGAIDPARARDRGHDQAAPGAVEAVGHLGHHPVRLARPGHAREGAVLPAGHAGEARVTLPVLSRPQVGEAAQIVVDGERAGAPPPTDGRDRPGPGAGRGAPRGRARRWRDRRPRDAR
ncbi:MAG: hypothetical protein RML12_01180 [Xanthomonadales bacterium]|nr:hypothetical protein [Xanthomonadales bacterium]